MKMIQQRIIPKVKFFLLFVVLLFQFFEKAYGTDYYISLTGNNSNLGTSPNSPWANLQKVNSSMFLPGDRILFKAGEIFTGTLIINANSKGNADSYIIIASYGQGRATINGTTTSAIRLENTEYIKVNNLNVIGAGRKTGNNQGDGVRISSSHHIEVLQLEATGFQRAGVTIFASNDIRIVEVVAHNNGFSGIFAYASGRARNNNIYIGYCKAYTNPGDPTITNNHSGNGILYYDTNNSLIEYCEAYDNGWDQPLGPPNGPVGIWTARCDKVTIQYCISHDNKSTSGDGGGFDLDGGTTNSLIQYCYSYNNKFAGYLLWEYGSSGMRNNTIRYCVTENDGGAGFVLGSSGTGNVENTTLYNNVVYTNANTAISIRQFGSGRTTTVKAYNNIFICDNNRSFLEGNAQVDLKGNCYWRPNRSFSMPGGYTDFATWANATGQEKIDGQIVGIYSDPLLINAGNGEKLTDPTQLQSLLAYKLQPQSPLINAGLDLSQFSIDPGPQDFYGVQIPNNGNFDIGINEFTSLVNTPVSCPGTGGITYERYDDIPGLSVNNLYTSNRWIIGYNYTTTLPLFEAPENVCDNCGVRMTALICPPETGNYTFWIAGDDHAELWISEDYDWTSNERIAYHTGWTRSKEWNKYTTQKGTVYLEVGKQYIVEANMKEQAIEDNLAVGWRKPSDGEGLAPVEVVPGSVLIPIPSIPNTSPTSLNQSVANFAAPERLVYGYPNPFSNEDMVLHFDLPANTSTRVSILNGYGEEVFNQVLLIPASQEITLPNSLFKSSGIYMVKVSGNGINEMQKVIKAN